MISRATAVLSLLTLVGCGGAKETISRVAVKGTVTKGGAPVKAAILNFIPLDVKAPAVSAMASEGKFTMTRENGPVAGNYRVEAEIHGESVVTTQTKETPTGRRMGLTSAPAGTKPGEIIDKPSTAEVTIPSGVTETEVKIDLK
jgi:hypothetical protein